MLWKVSALGATMVAASATMGCVEEPMGPPTRVPEPYRAMASAQLQTVGEPGPQDRPFGEALVAYALEVDRIHAFEGARADAAIGWAVLQLARILERLPAAAAEPALRRAAAAIRANETETQTETETDPDDESSKPAVTPVERTKQSLAIVATALLQLAATAYRETPQIAVAARVFAATVDGINPESSSPDRPGILDALVHAQRVLAGMYAVNVAPPNQINHEPAGVRPG
jgi:hypothetical protein